MQSVIRMQGARHGVLPPRRALGLQYAHTVLTGLGGWVASSTVISRHSLHLHGEHEREPF